MRLGLDIAEKTLGIMVVAKIGTSMARMARPLVLGQGLLVRTPSKSKEKIAPNVE